MTSDEATPAGFGDASAQAPPPPARPGIGPDGREAVRRVSLLVRTLSTETQVYADLVCQRLDIHRTDLSALGHLERARVDGDPMTQADLGRALGMSGAAITALADRLERTGHVARRRSQADRRKILLETTDHARETGREQFGPLAQRTRAALERYTDEELELVGRVLQDLVEASREASRRTWTHTEVPPAPDPGGPAGSAGASPTLPPTMPPTLPPTMPPTMPPTND